MMIETWPSLLRRAYLSLCLLPETSTILAAARSMYGSRSNAMTLELNASDDRGIGVVRDQIKSFAGTKQVGTYSCE